LLAEECGEDPRTPVGRGAIFAALANTRSFCEAGPAMKPMRWMSIGDCWEWHRPHIRRHRFLLGEMADVHKGLTPEDYETGRAADAEGVGAEEAKSPEEVVGEMKACNTS